MIELDVADMSCEHCVATIRKAVREVDAASACEVDLAAHKVRIASERPAGDFVAAIAGAGYTPRLA